MNARILPGVATVVILLTACASSNQSNSLVDYYFPEQGEYMNTQYRHGFDKLLSGPPPAADYPARERQLYAALHGDVAAFHAFVHNPDRDAEAFTGENWVYECVFLLLRLGDDRFATLLRSEDHATREAVGVAIDPQINWTKHQFPKTRSLYKYRYVRQPRNG